MNPTRRLEFDVVATGLLESSFVGNADNWFFAADVVGFTPAAGIDLTGNIAATGPAAHAPEPGTSVLLLGGLGLIAIGRWRGNRAS